MGHEKDQIKFLVTGGGGFVGSAIVKRLKGLGYQVGSYSRKSYPWMDELGIKQFQGDLTDPVAIDGAVAQHKIVIHSAALAGFWGSYADYYRPNVLGTKHLLQSCQKHQIEKLLFTSTASVVFGGESIHNGQAEIPYPKKASSFYTSTKAKAEQLILTANTVNLKTLALRPHIVLGPGDTQIIPRLIERAKSGRLPIIGSGSNQIDIIHIDNLVDAHLAALKAMDQNPNCLGKAYFVSNGDPVIVWDFINSILTGLGLPAITKKISYRMALTLATLLSGFNQIFTPAKEPKLTPFLVKELSQSHWFNIDPAKQDLGYKPMIDSSQTLESILTAFSKNQEPQNPKPNTLNPEPN